MTARNKNTVFKSGGTLKSMPSSSWNVRDQERRWSIDERVRVRYGCGVSISSKAAWSSSSSSCSYRERVNALIKNLDERRLRVLVATLDTRNKRRRNASSHHRAYTHTTTNAISQARARVTRARLQRHKQREYKERQHSQT